MKILSKYNLLDIYRMATEQNISDDEKNIVSLFNYYYEGKQE